ncbi:MAG: hypothetical protein H6742_12055 [Alphaproteobacteria bacterium]|nr:hypothetical protein [Alphaproteobacteria bacterium]
MDPANLVPLATVGLGLFGWFVLTRVGRQHEAQRRMAEAVDPLGLQVVREVIGSGVTATGVVDGFGFDARYVEPGSDWRSDEHPDPVATLRVRLDLPFALPRGIVVKRMGVGSHVADLLGTIEDHPLVDPLLDQALHVKGEDPDAIAELLDHPTVVEVLSALLRQRIEPTIEERRITVREATPVAIYPKPAVDLALALAQALREARQAPVQSAAAELGLRCERVGADGSRTFLGTVQGVDVKVVLDQPRESDGALQCVIQAPIRPHLPAGMRLRPRVGGAPGRSGGIGTGNPVLDTVVELQASEPESARALLMRDELTGPLLEVLHAWPGAYVHPRAVVIVHPGSLRRQLADAVRAAAELAAVLSGR